MNLIWTFILNCQMHGQLYHVTHQFSNLSVLYKVMDQRIRSLNSGVNEKLRDKARAVYLLNLHLETVLWFLHGGLLPEADDGEEQETGSLPYPRRQMEAFYQSRRSDIEHLSSSIQANEVLLIEQLVPSSVVELWDEERGKLDEFIQIDLNLTFLYTRIKWNALNKKINGCYWI